MATRTSTSVRLDDAQVIRLDRIVEAMRARLAGLDVGRSTALRLALERGMDALEAELRVTARGRKTATSPTRGTASRAKSKPQAKSAKPQAKSAKPKPQGKYAKGKSARSEPRKAAAKGLDKRPTKGSAAKQRSTKATRARVSTRR